MKSNNISETDIWAYLSKTADESTVKKVDLWRNSASYDEAFFKKVANIHHISADHAYSEINLGKAKERFFDSVESKNVRHLPRRNFLRYAAAVALLITTATYFLITNGENKRVLVQTSYGESKQVNLPDGSVVWLNASTTLAYSPESPRQLYLEGEAFFEVAKNKEVPFIVSTHDHLQVRALGTSFNVRSYKENDFTETVLYTGKVEVSSDKHFEEKIEMLPNDQVTFLRKETRLVTSGLDNLESISSWREGKIQFRNKTFQDIALDFRIQLGVKISFKNEAISHSKFTGTFDKEVSIKEILEILKMTKEFEYKQISSNEWLIL